MLNVPAVKEIEPLEDSTPVSSSPPEIAKTSPAATLVVPEISRVLPLPRVTLGPNKPEEPTVMPLLVKSSVPPVKFSVPELLMAAASSNPRLSVTVAPL